MTKKKKPLVYPHLSEGLSLVDTHCHLDMSAYSDDLDQVIGNARAHGIGSIITIGIDPDSSKKAVDIASRHADVYATVGVHPHNVESLDDTVYEELRDLARSEKVVGYGEVGLDYVKEYAPRQLQLHHFEKQVRMAGEIGLPLVVHDREAHDDVLSILRRAAPFPAGGVMHCFSGDADYARAVLDLGFYISIPGVVTFKKAEVLQQAVIETPLESLLVETDGPFLAPEPRRGKRNEPSLVLFTAAKIAELKNTTLDSVAKATTSNAGRLFGIKVV